MLPSFFLVLVYLDLRGVSGIGLDGGLALSEVGGTESLKSDRLDLYKNQYIQAKSKSRKGQKPFLYTCIFPPSNDMDDGLSARLEARNDNDQETQPNSPMKPEVASGTKPPISSIEVNSAS